MNRVIQGDCLEVGQIDENYDILILCQKEYSINQKIEQEKYHNP